MKIENILDAPEPKQQPSGMRELILWWEKKRLFFNIAVLFIMCIVIYTLWTNVTQLGFPTTAGYGIYFLFGANLFYTLGWGVGGLMHLLYKRNDWNPSGKWILFILGTLFSQLWMLVIFSDALLFGGK